MGLLLNIVVVVVVHSGVVAVVAAGLGGSLRIVLLFVRIVRQAPVGEGCQI